MIMNQEKKVTAAIIVIGDEVLSGRTRDANIQFLASALGEMGIQLAEARVIPDDQERIVEAVNTLRKACDYVFTTGGIGPTHDDITAQSVAQAFGVSIERNAEAESRLKSHYRPQDLNAARLSMADIPVGATLIDNPISKAPGFALENVFVLAGVPNIAQAMFDGIRPQLTGGARVLSQTLTAEVQEGRMAAGLGGLAQKYPSVSFGSYPYFRPGQFGVSIVVRSTDADLLRSAAAEVADLMRSLGGDPRVGSF
ncbi:MAG: competence/damage-inducible protein A [Magnetospiraceae bacterium]